MIPFKGVEGIRNLCLERRCDICGKKMKYTTLCGTDCARCFVWAERHRYYLIMKYIRFSMEKYLHGKIPKPRSIPSGYKLV